MPRESFVPETLKNPFLPGEMELIETLGGLLLQTGLGQYGRVCEQPNHSQMKRQKE